MNVPKQWQMHQDMDHITFLQVISLILLFVHSLVSSIQVSLFFQLQGTNFKHSSLLMLDDIQLQV